MRKLFKVLLVVGVLAGLVLVAKKLMGGLGPEPGSANAPKEWPSLVPEPAAPTSSGNGASSNGDGEASEPAPDADSTTDA